MVAVTSVIFFIFVLVIIGTVVMYFWGPDLSELSQSVNVLLDGETTTSETPTASEGSTGDGLEQTTEIRIPNKPENTKVIIKEVNKPCPACQCPECPDCNCPECPDCECPTFEAEVKALRSENEYLKWMVRYTGVIARRENAVNRAISVRCPGSFGMVPFVQQADEEARLMKSHISKDKQMYGYFQNYFSRYTGIDSKRYQEIL